MNRLTLPYMLPLLLSAAIAMSIASPSTANADVVEDVLREASRTALFTGRTPRGRGYVLLTSTTAFHVRLKRDGKLDMKFVSPDRVLPLIRRHGTRV